MEFHLTDIIMPRPGSMLWTILTFLVLLFVLRKWAWKPILGALEKREQTIKSDLENARAEREEAERLRKQYQENLAGAQKESQQIVQEARRAAEEVKDSTIREAKAVARNTVEKAKVEIEAQKVKASRELRAEVAALSAEAIRRILQRGLTQQDQERIISAGLSELDQIDGNGKK